ncbi:hypothetical protein [Saliniradius amylolyticus]|nr:hypothetical protein [Saliniradius amylolyticus]
MKQTVPDSAVSAQDRYVGVTQSLIYDKPWQIVNVLPPKACY